MMLQKLSTAVQSGLIGLSLSVAMVGSAHSQQSVMVAGDSISAGFEEPSYRLPLLDALDDVDCPVSMVGDQSLNNFDYRQPNNSSNGNHESPFTPGNGYDTDHQAFPAIRADQVANGVSSSFYTVDPIGTYVGNEQPDFVLIHLGTNDMGAAFRAGIMSSDAQVNAWANTTVSDVRRVIDRTISAHNNPSTLRVLVANFIPYARRNSDILTPADLVVAERASELFTKRLESMVLDRADNRVLIVDVETGFDPITMTNDGIHPNSVGEEHLAGAFLPVLRGAGLCDNAPFLTSPAAGETVDGDSVVLQWVNNGLNVSRWRVRVGDSQSGESSTYFDSGNLPGGARSVSVAGLPADLTNVFVSLQYTAGGSTDQVLSSFFSRSGSGDGSIATMQRPLPGALLTSSSVNFSWESNDRDYQQWYVRVGSTPGGTEHYDSGRITDKSTRSVSISGLPTNASTVYLELSGKTRAGPWDVQVFTYTASGGGIPDKVLLSNEWYQISLPYNPGSNNRVRDVFGDALPVNDYATTGNNGTWVMWAYELDAVSQTEDTYRRLTVNDRLQVGTAYWIKHVLPGSVTVSAPAGAGANSGNVSSAQVGACENPGRCYAVPVNAQVTDGELGRFSMVGYPLSNPTTALQLRVGTSSNVGCSGSRDCSMAESSANNLLFKTIFVHRPEISDYADVGPLDGVLNPWEGFWAVQMRAAAGQNAMLIMSEPEL